VYVERAQLREFRNYSEAELSLAAEGVTVLRGPNGAGKTNLLEALGYLATLKSFRGAQSSAMVRSGHERAFVGARVRAGPRVVDLSAEIVAFGGGRLKVNSQYVRRSGDFAGLLQVTVFSPDDVAIVKEGPSGRRDFLDNLVGALWPELSHSGASFERSLRQRNALLRSSGGTLSTAMRRVLASWDAQVAEAGEALAEARRAAVAALQPRAQHAYERLGGEESVQLGYEQTWARPLLECLERSLEDDLKQGATTRGPHRDDLWLGLGGLPARVQASQGQQRGLVLALKLASHELLMERSGTAPVLLLDDVFSELDARRSAALASCLPGGQALVATAGELPACLQVAAVVEVSAGSFRRSANSGEHSNGA